ncbi:hypothetical protein MMC30_003932 [Trapelia coarctata]|nr:hypothetical protein [Trapelia coarctata]
MACKAPGIDFETNGTPGIAIGSVQSWKFHTPHDYLKTYKMPTVTGGPLLGPGETHVYSNPGNGCIITMDVFIDRSNAPRYLELASGIAKKWHQMPECTFCELSQHPDDKGHIRILHGWTKDSNWWRETFTAEAYFQEFMGQVSKMWIKPRQVEHFDRVPVV